MTKFLLSIIAVSFFFIHPLLSFEGLYIGGGPGGSLLDGRQEGFSVGTLTSGSISNVYTGDHSTDYFKESPSGQFFIGYGARWRCLFAGVEVFGQYLRHSDHHHFLNDNIFPLDPASEGIFNSNRATIGPWHWGVDFRPGVLLTPQTLLYGRVGITQAHVKYSSIVSNVLVLGPTTSVISVNERAKRCQHFLRVGLGVEQFLCPQFSLRWDYAYTKYKFLTTQNGAFQPGTTNVLSVSDSNRLSLRTHELTLALSYYFCPYRNSCLQRNNCYPNALPCGQSTQSHRQSNFCGWYLGAGVGGAFKNEAHNADVVTIAPGPESNTLTIRPHVFNSDINKKAVRAIVEGGYGFRANLSCLRLFTGLELFAQYSPDHNKDSHKRTFFSGFSPATFSANSTVTSHTEIHPWQYGVQIRPGILLSPSILLFGTVGASAAKLSVQYRETFENLVTGDTLNFPLRINKRRCVLRVGGGLEYVLCCKWHLRADYIYTNYRSISLKGSRSICFSPPINTASVQSNSSIHSKDHAITIGLNRYL